jgi:group I intron endonuclease
MKIAGCGFVYMITSPSGKIYVGSTEDIDQRESNYKKGHCKGQIKLYRSFKKYGYINHKFEVVWAGLLEDMLKYETMIGWGFNVLDRKSGLNCQLPKLGSIYKCMSDDVLNKMSLAAKKRGFSKEHREKLNNSHNNMSDLTRKKFREAGKIRGISKNCRLASAKARRQAVIQYSKDGVFIKEWDNISLAAKFLSLHGTHISKCCKGKAKITGGFRWKYKNKE